MQITIKLYVASFAKISNFFLQALFVAFSDEEIQEIFSILSGNYKITLNILMY